MYLKKVSGKRAVILPDGSVLSLADLPPPTTTHWVVRRKAAVAFAVMHGLISATDAEKAYAISAEELRSWIDIASTVGTAGLKSKSRQLARARD